jgi:OCT family organic cation transporter-like MFS transporter 4/5
LFILIVRFARRFVNAVVLYGLTMTSVDVSPDPYLGFILSSVVEFPADVITFLLLHKVGRRIPYSGFFLAGGAVCIVAAFLTEGKRGTSSREVLLVLINDI